ncbi:hypothetical protein HYX17_00995 [Candidatus Woesearchaeota archaeon]|nr:hypothetical protein [Candidatus Woesearchaeota archaeon]
MFIRYIKNKIENFKKIEGYNIKLLERKENYAKFLVDRKKELEVYILGPKFYYPEKPKIPKNYHPVSGKGEVYKWIPPIINLRTGRVDERTTYPIIIEIKDENKKKKYLIYHAYSIKKQMKLFNKVLKNINKEYHELTNYNVELKNKDG